MGGGPQFGLKIGGGGRTPSLDPLLLHLERVVPLYCQGWIQEGGGEGGLGG